MESLRGEAWPCSRGICRGQVPPYLHNPLSRPFQGNAGKPTRSHLCFIVPGNQSALPSIPSVAAARQPPCHEWVPEGPRTPEPQSHWVICRHRLSTGELMPQSQGGQRARAHAEELESWPCCMTWCAPSVSPTVKWGSQLSSYHGACMKTELQAWHILSSGFYKIQNPVFWFPLHSQSPAWGRRPAGTH